MQNAINSQSTFHYLARALIISGSHILVAHQIGADNTFLPGGHIELGESAVNALQREILEEIGLSAEVGDFLGAVEAVFQQDGHLHAEINLVFACQLPGIDPGAKITPKEQHLEFFWVPVTDTAACNLLPVPMRTLAQRSQHYRAFWGSSVEL